MAGAKPDTWMPMFWGDYLRDTGHLSTAEHGAYMLLIGHYWTTGKPIPDGDAVLARITRQGVAAWRKMRDVIAAFFIVADGVWRHGRIDDELDRAMRFIEKQAANGARGGRPRSQTKPNPIPNDKPNETTLPSPPNNYSHGKTSVDAPRASAPYGARAGTPALPAGGEDDSLWRARIRTYRPGGFWIVNDWGPRPEDKGTRVPPAILAEWQARQEARQEEAA